MLRGLGHHVIAGTCSGAASQWAFPPVLVSGDFYMATASKAGSVKPGASTTVGINTQGAGPPAQITLSASGLPAGATATFSPATVTAPNSATMTINTTASTAQGSYPITVTGKAGTFTHTDTYTLTVGTAQANDFSLALDPRNATAPAGTSVTTKVSAGVVTGSPGTVALSASAVAPGVTVSFSPTSVTPGGPPATMTVTTTTAVFGPTLITVIGTAGSVTHAIGFGLDVTSGPGGGTPILLSQGKPATASSTKSASMTAKNAVDGNASTRWASKKGIDPVWLQVDLGAKASITEVKLTWDKAYGSAYQIQVSDDGQTWTTINTTSAGDGGTDDLTVSGSGRYVRMNGTKRGTNSGYSLDEFQVYGTTS